MTPECSAELLARGTVMRLAVSDEAGPYVLPLSYGYDADAGLIFFHCAAEGRKLDAIARDPRVCFEVSEHGGATGEASPCTWTVAYESVIGMGVARALADLTERLRALSVIMRQQGGPEGPFEERWLRQTVLVEVRIETLSGKRSG